MKAIAFIVTATSMTLLGVGCSALQPVSAVSSEAVHSPAETTVAPAAVATIETRTILLHSREAAAMLKESLERHHPEIEYDFVEAGKAMSFQMRGTSDQLNRAVSFESETGRLLWTLIAC